MIDEEYQLQWIDDTQECDFVSRDVGEDVSNCTDIIFSLSQNRVPEIGHTGVGCIFSDTQIVQVINRFAFELDLWISKLP